MSMSVEERIRARAKRTCERRAAFFRGLITNTPDPYEQLTHACSFARAVAKGLHESARHEEVHALAMVIAAAADERNKA